MPRSPECPAHLTDESAEWWGSVADGYLLESWQLRTLTAAAEAHDRMSQARRQVTADGIVVEDRFGQMRAHPAVGIERDSRIAYLRAVRELALETDEHGEPRPPRVRGRR